MRRGVGFGEFIGGLDNNFSLAVFPILTQDKSGSCHILFLFNGGTRHQILGHLCFYGVHSRPTATPTANYDTLGPGEAATPANGGAPSNSAFFGQLLNGAPQKNTPKGKPSSWGHTQNLFDPSKCS